MSYEPFRIVTFRGGVSCRRDANGPLGLTLIGSTTDHPDEWVSVSFSGRAPEALPEVLEEPTVYRIDERRFRIASHPREWLVEATAVHVHREIAPAFYHAIPPRHVPWRKRLFFRFLLAMMANSWGKRILLALRGR
ncbi:MAG TPA: hypothetical protein VGC34_12905 [Steroidobacteraceae bacterium]